MNDFDQPGFQDEPKKQEPINNLKAALSKSVLEQEIKEKYGKEKKEVEQETHDALEGEIDHANHDTSKSPSKHHDRSTEVIVEGFRFNGFHAINAEVGHEREIKKGPLKGFEGFATVHFVGESKMKPQEMEKKKSLTAGVGLMTAVPVSSSLDMKAGGFVGASIVKERITHAKSPEGDHSHKEALTGGEVEPVTHTRKGGEVGLRLSLLGKSGPLKGLEGEILIERGTDPWHRLFASYPMFKKFSATVESTPLTPFTVGVAYKIKNGQLYVEFLPQGPHKGAIVGGKWHF